jgi:23S rRNA pseudouridine1911/1915/1917 synthase
LAAASRLLVSSGTMFEATFTVEDGDARERLDRFLERRLEGVSRGRLRRAIASGEITINGESRDSGRRLRAGDVVVVRTATDLVRAMRPEAIPLSVLFEDESMLVVDKPAGMFAHPTSRVHSGTLLNAALFHVADRGEVMSRPLLVHRLDRATSGVLVLSKTARAHATLARAWHDREVEKRYVAVLCGALEASRGTIDAPIGGSRDHHPGFRVMEGGRHARTRYAVLGELDPFSFVELEPITGRTNQLRIHAAHAGAAIAGDDLHGQPELRAFYESHPRAPRAVRLCLHASSLAFRHPVSSELLRIDAPVPDEIATFVAEIERYRFETASR